MPKNGSMAANVRVIIMILLEKIVSNKLYISDILTNEKVVIFYCFKQDNFFELIELMRIHYSTAHWISFISNSRNHK